jgi:FeS assembly protein SufD
MGRTRLAKPADTLMNGTQDGRALMTALPAWLTEVRAEARERYAKLDAPRWRRTDLSDVDVEALARRAAQAPPPKLPRAPQAGVLLMPLADAAREHPDFVRPLVGVHARADKWEILQTALWSSGAFLFVEKGVEVAEPLRLEPVAPAAGALSRDLIVLERQAKATLLARTRGASPGALVLAGADVDVREGASLSLATMQDLDHGALLLSARRATLARDASLAWTDGQFGAGTAVVVNETTLAGPGSNLRFIGAFFGSAKQHLDVTNSAFHDGAHTSSRLDMKGALTDDGYSANYSIVNIGPQARNASGHQHQETLILSAGARADAIPKLDVENNDVSASHGATVGQVDPEQLFYLRSRGFDELAAKRLIVEGFFGPLLEQVPVEEVRNEIGAALVNRLK